MNVNAAEDATGMIVIDENIVRNNSCFQNQYYVIGKERKIFLHLENKCKYKHVSHAN